MSSKPFPAKLRIFLVFLFFVPVYTILTFVLLLVSFLLKLLLCTEYAVKRWEWFIARNLAHYFHFLLGVRVQVTGKENIPANSRQMGRFCLFSNHTSMLDITHMLSDVPLKLGFVAKKNLIKMPLFSVYLHMANCVMIDRDNIHSNIKAIKDGVSNIDKGIPMMIFPEGSRSKNGNVGEFKKGSMKLATRSNATVIPAAITGLRDYLEGRQSFFVKSRCHISILPVFEVSSLSDAEKDSMAVSVEGMIRAEVERLRSL